MPALRWFQFGSIRDQGPPVPTPQSFNSGLSLSACSRGVSRPFRIFQRFTSGNAVGRPASGPAAACRDFYVPLLPGARYLFRPQPAPNGALVGFFGTDPSPVQHRASRPGAGTHFRPAPAGYSGNQAERSGNRTRAATHAYARKLHYLRVPRSRSGNASARRAASSHASP